MEDKVMDAVVETVKSVKTELQKSVDGVAERIATVETTLVQNRETAEKMAQKFSEIEKSLHATKKSGKTFEQLLKEAINNLEPQLKSKSPGFVTVGTFEYGSRTKDAITMTLAAATDGDIPQAEREVGTTLQFREQFNIRQFANVGTTSSEYYEWVEQVLKEGSAGMHVEGQPKTAFSYEWKVNRAIVSDIAIQSKLSEKLLRNIGGINSEITGELMFQLAKTENTQFFTGTGDPDTLYGVTLAADPLELVTIPKKEAPNMWDAIGAAVIQISRKTLGNARANVIYLAPEDWYGLVHNVVSLENGYISPVVATPQGTFYNGIPIVMDYTIPAGYFLVADMSKYNIRDRKAVTIAIGLQNDDFGRNLVSVRAEKALLTFVKTNHAGSFVYDTFANAITFLTDTNS
jgi:HK97 family phage major capsid protein